MEGALSDGSGHPILLTASEIARRVTALGQEISKDYSGKEVVFVVTLKGAFVFASDLLRHIESTLDAKVDFVQASSYGNDLVSSGSVRVLGGDTSMIRGRHVLVVEDIIDTGRTIATLIERLHGLDARSVEVVTLLVKDREVPDRPAARYVGFHIPDVFVIGYGLDAAQKYRHLPEVHVLTDK